MTEDELLNIVYRYYPRNIDSISEKELYLISMEYNNLIDKIEAHKSNYLHSKTEFASILKYENNHEVNFKDSTYFEWMDRCYTFEFSEKHGTNVTLLKIFKSIIAPVYSFKYFQVKSLVERTKFINVSENYFQNQNLITSLKLKFENDGFEELDKNLVLKKLSNVNFDDITMGNFTFFNAFYNSQNF